MNKISILLLLLLCCSLAKRTKAQVNLTGHLKGLNADSVTFVYPTDKGEKSDRVSVKNELFSWTANINTPTLISLNLPFFGESFPYQFFAEPGTMRMDGSIASINDLLAINTTGSPTQDLFKSYVLERKKIIEEEIVLDNKIARSKPDSITYFKSRLSVLEQNLKDLPKKYVKANPKNFTSLLLMEQLISGRYDYAKTKLLFDNLDEALKTSTQGISVRKSLDVLERSAAGKPLKPFNILDMEGKNVSLTDYKGKILLVDFWASWCAPCRAENPNLLKNYQKYHDKGFDIVGISCDQDLEKWKKAVQEDQLPWKQLREWTILQYYGITTVPSNFLVDASGNILATNMVGEQLTDKLNELFNK